MVGLFIRWKPSKARVEKVAHDGAASVVCQTGALADIRWAMTGKRRTSVVQFRISDTQTTP
jgi:hypothetical protein